jgi:hypothetical protein
MVLAAVMVIGKVMVMVTMKDVVIEVVMVHRKTLQSGCLLLPPDWLQIVWTHHGKGEMGEAKGAKSKERAGENEGADEKGSCSGTHFFFSSSSNMRLATPVCTAGADI